MYRIVEVVIGTIVLADDPQVTLALHFPSDEVVIVKDLLVFIQSLHIIIREGRRGGRGERSERKDTDSYSFHPLALFLLGCSKLLPLPLLHPTARVVNRVPATYTSC